MNVSERPLAKEQQGDGARRRFQFSLMTLIEIVTIAATALTLWFSWRPPVVVAVMLASVAWLGALLGFMVARRCSITPSQKKGIGVLIFTMAMILGVPASLSWMGATAWWEFGHPTELRDLNYEQFAARSGNGPFNPKGASHISAYSVHSIDSHDEYLAMSIPPEAYEVLLDRQSRLMTDYRGFASHESLYLGPVRKSTATGAAFPSNWPPQDTSPPPWWKPEQAAQTAERTCWELQTNASGTLRSRGWYWLDDRKAAKLWIWEWSYQHCSLGWEKK